MIECGNFLVESWELKIVGQQPALLVQRGNEFFLFIS